MILVFLSENEVEKIRKYFFPITNPVLNKGRYFRHKLSLCLSRWIYRYYPVQIDYTFRSVCTCCIYCTVCVKNIKYRPSEYMYFGLKIVIYLSPYISIFSYGSTPNFVYRCPTYGCCFSKIGNRGW